MIEMIKKYDPNFLESKFLTFVDNVFVQLHLAIMTKNLEKIKHFVSQDVYQSLTSKIDQLNNQKVTQVYGELNVKETKILNVDIKNDEIFIKVKLTSRYLDYIIDDKMQMISGNMDSRVETDNYLVFKKKVGMEKSIHNHYCFSCGHSMDINQNGKCEYCGSIYDLNQIGFILISLEV